MTELARLIAAAVIYRCPNGFVLSLDPARPWVLHVLVPTTKATS